MENQYSPASRKILHYLLSHPFDRVSLLTHLPPQVKATLQAMYSRNDMPMRDTLLKIIVTVELGLDKKGATRKYEDVSEQEKETVYKHYAGSLPADEPPLYHLFDKKADHFLGEWAVKHGHNSIKEGAFISYIAEGVSIITAKELEDDPLFHGQELSTRYKSFAKQTIPIPPTLAASTLKKELEDYFKESLENYLMVTKIMNDYQEKTFPKPENITPAGWKQTLRAETFDNARYYLNAGITTSLGIVEDARTLERKLRNMLVSPFPETREVALEIIEKAKSELPTLITYTIPNEYKKETERLLEKDRLKIMEPFPQDKIPQKRVRLLHATPDLENQILAYLLYDRGNHPYGWEQISHVVKMLPIEQKKNMLHEKFEKMGKHDEPLRSLRYARIAFELYPDFGAWRDIQRQRRCNQTFPFPTCDYGYDVPWLVKEANLEENYQKHQDTTKKMFEKAREICPDEAVVIPTLGFRVKQLIDADIEEWIYIWRLRTTEYGHFSYRQIFIETFEQAKAHMPLLAEIIEQKGLIKKNELRHGRLVEEQRYEQRFK